MHVQIVYCKVRVVYRREMTFWLMFVAVWSPQMFEMVQWLLSFTFEPTRGDGKPRPSTHGLSIIAPSPFWIQRARIQLDQLVYLARFKLCHSSLVHLVLLLLSPDQKAQKWCRPLAVFVDNIALPPSPSWMLQSGVVVVVITVVCFSPRYSRIVQTNCSGWCRRLSSNTCPSEDPPCWMPPSLTSRQQMTHFRSIAVTSPTYPGEEAKWLLDGCSSPKEMVHIIW